MLYSLRFGQKEFVADFQMFESLPEGQLNRPLKQKLGEPSLLRSCLLDLALVFQEHLVLQAFDNKLLRIALSLARSSARRRSCNVWLTMRG